MVGCVGLRIPDPSEHPAPTIDFLAELTKTAHQPDQGPPVLRIPPGALEAELDPQKTSESGDHESGGVTSGEVERIGERWA